MRYPWTAMIEYDEGRLGRVGHCHSSASPEQAVADAKAWHRAHAQDRDWYFMKPSCRIELGVPYDSAIYGR